MRPHKRRPGHRDNANLLALLIIGAILTQAVPMLFAEQLYDPNAWFGQAAPLLVLLGIASGLIGALVGRGRWKDAAESAEFRLAQSEKEQVLVVADREKKIAALEAAAAEREKVIESLNGRIQELQGAIETVGGAKVMEAVQAQGELGTRRFEEAMKKHADLFSATLQSIYQHEERAQERHERSEARDAERHRDLLSAIEKLANGRSPA